MKFKIKVFNYMFLFILSGIIYSMMTSIIIDNKLGNKFYILFLDAIVNIFILIFIYKLRNNKKKKLLTIAIGGISSITLSFFDSYNLIFITIFYITITFAIDFNINDSSAKIIEVKKKEGMKKLSIYSSFAQLIGFFAGSFFNNINKYFLSAIIIMCFLIKGYECFNNNNNNINETKNILPKEYDIKEFIWDNNWILLLLFSSTATFWIPIFIYNLNKMGLNQFYFLPFVLPGIFSIIILKFFKNTSTKIINISFMSIIIIFILTLKYIFLSITVFSIYVGISMLITSSLKNKILSEYPQKRREIIIEIFKCMSCIVVLIFSITSIVFNEVQWIILLSDFIGAIILIIFNKKKEFY